MMKRLISVILLAAGLGLVWSAGGMHASLIAARERRYREASETLAQAPPLLVFTTVVLGGFRGTIADILWLRMSHLQDQGRFLEVAQLADWVTKLEPLTGEVWAFHAWNMAYNISVMMPDARERWRWVEEGLRLLRDRGLRYNPSDPVLYYELAWLFQHKIGGTTDRVHTYYKQEWRRQMSDLLGGARPDYRKLEDDPDRLRRAREQYKLEPGSMQAVEAAYGPLDWRLADTHAIYWAYRGLPFADGLRRESLERLIRHSLERMEREP